MNTEIKEQDKVRDVFLTTVDNPFDPSEQFKEWFIYDESHGYHTCSKLANIAVTFPFQEEEEMKREIERAIDEIIYMEGDSFYKKIVTET